jgi:two-component system OmpR family response regulator
MRAPGSGRTPSRPTRAIRPRILIVADDAALRGTLARWLMAADYGVELAESPKRAREVVAGNQIALGIVVADLPDAAHVDLVRELGTAIGRLVIVAAGLSEVEQWAAIPLDLAACLSQPLNEEQVLARINAALPPHAPNTRQSGPERLRFEGLTLDVGGRSCLDAAGAEIALTRAEFSLLLELARHPGQVLSRGELSQAAAGRGAGPDDRSVDVLISRLRRKVESDAKVPRIIVTVPGGGYKFMAKPQVSSPGADSTSDASFTIDKVSDANGSKPPIEPPLSLPGRRSAVSARPTAWILSAAAALAATAIVVMLFWYPGHATNPTPGSVESAQKFDAAAVPLLTDAARRDLATYPTQPDPKALAISVEGAWGMSVGAADLETAKRQALEQCSARAIRYKNCKIYATGRNVVWQAPALSRLLSSDLRTEPINSPFSLQELQFIGEQLRQGIVINYPKIPDHKALAIRRGGLAWWTSGLGSPAEVARVTAERCGEFYQDACLLIAVNGLMTVQIPRLHRPTDFFMLTTEPEMSDQDKRRIGKIYEQKEWRALVRAKSGSWYAVANAASEAAAAEAALASCAQSERDCRLHAIGNFRVADEK